MAGPINAKQFFDGEMGIFLSCREIFVSQEFLDAAKVGTVVEQVGGEGMTKQMRVNV